MYELKTCPNCFSFFITKDARKKYCKRSCKERAHKRRHRLTHPEVRVGRKRVRSRRENEQSVTLRSIRENRKATEKELREHISYLLQQNERLRKQLNNTYTSAKR